MRRFLVSIFFLPFLVLAQQERPGCIFKNSISGTIYEKSIFHGGVDIDEDAVKPWPLADATFYIVQWNGAESASTFVQSFKTNPNGSFKVYLPPGIYGIVAENDLDSLKQGQWLPSSSEGGDSIESSHWSDSNSWWECNALSPFDLTSGSIENISLIRQSHTYCYDCP